MPQKPLSANKKIVKKKEAANRHGKTVLTKIGKFDKPPKKGKALVLHTESQDLTKAINKRNEYNSAGVAESKGGKLKMIKGPPRVLQPKDKQKKKSAASKAAEKPADEEMDD